MDLNASFEFDAPVERVWALLMDTDAIAQCIPGCKGLKPLGDDRYETELGVAMAAFSGQFKGTVSIEDKVPLREYRLAIEGAGRPGFVKGHAHISLTPDGPRTTVAIAAHADVGGTVARVGQRLLEGVARTMMERFFSCLTRKTRGPADPS